MAEINILYAFQYMEPVIATKRFKHSEFISPGVVGSVGDVLGSVRLRQSTPSMPMRYETAFSGPNESKLGSNVQDGDSKSYTSKGGFARVVDSRLERTSFKTNHGWVYQDVRSVDKLLEPVMGSTGRADWVNRVANIYQAKITGNNFLPLPDPYGPTSMTRGSQIPRIIAVDRPVMPDLNVPTMEKEPVKESVVASICFDENGRPVIRKQTKAPPGKSETNTTPAGQPKAPTPQAPGKNAPQPPPVPTEVSYPSVPTDEDYSGISFGGAV